MNMTKTKTMERSWSWRRGKGATQGEASVGITIDGMPLDGPLLNLPLTGRREGKVTGF